jgi:RNA-directed DNA polymerase
MMRAVRKHTSCPGVILYIERWLKAPVQLDDGTVVVREKGTPQGGVISPLLANLFLHYAFDRWMRTFRHVPFERYADDVICHCGSESQARHLRAAVERRFADCKLELYPQKTQVVYARMIAEGGTILSTSSTSWASPSGLGRSRTRGRNTSSASRLR